MFKTIATAISLLLSISFFAQDALLLMNGREWKGNIQGEEGSVILFEVTNKKGKEKIKEVHKNDVFSYTKSGESSVILYVQDTNFGDIYSVDEMKVYIQGEADARDNYHARLTALVGFLLSGTAAYLTEGGLIGSISFPIAYGILQLAPKILIREKFMSNPNFKFNDVYADGFEPVARSKKILSGLGGGFLGAAAGIGVYVLVSGGL
ncbi:MAG: hypothetical protein SGI87_04980 [Flavobacteriales bacterium]|nr:hypothetical protein [Flavobacteriales bacterium]